MNLSKYKTITLSKKEEGLRNFILNGNIFWVTLKIGLPIAFFQSLNQIFRLFDSFMAAGISSSAASMVSYFGQINLILSGIGLGLAAGSSLKISHAYGEGDYDLVKKQISSLLALTVGICIVLSLLVVPFSTPLLRLIGTPEEFIQIGRSFFVIEFISTLVTFCNCVYIAIERAQGNSKKILSINLIAMMLKFSFTAFCIYVLQGGVTLIALSTLLSQCFITVIAIRNLRGKSDVFKFSLRDVSFKSTILLPMILISIPIMIERSAFHMGKVVINSMVILYGPLVVGGLGISNQICGASVSPQMGMQDASISVMAQNRGARNIKRAFNAFKSLLLINLIMAILLFIPSYLFATQITSIFAIGDPVFHDTLLSIYLYDVWGILPLAVFSSVMALLFGFGYTKVTLFMNFCRIFLFRIPILWYIQNYTNSGSEAAGLIMIISNIMVGFLSIGIAFVTIHRLCKEHRVSFWSWEIKEVKEEIAHHSEHCKT